MIDRSPSTDRRQPATTLWRRARTVFDDLAPLDAAARRARLDALADDPELRDAVGRLLDHDRSDDFLEMAWSPPRSPAADPWVGSRLGPYRVVRELGRGGAGIVFLAERDDAEFDHRVAVKVLVHAVDERTRERFHQERQILAQLVHPNIARLIGGGTTPDGVPYGIMDLVDGVPITDFCDRHELPIEQRIELFCDVCDAVQHAHRNLVVHRDLKPSNILVTADGRPKLLDFGIAKVLGGSSAEDRDPTRWMTPAYASPEQLLGRPITTATDVYSLGVLLFELLCGRRPHDSDRSELLATTTTVAPSRAWQDTAHRDPSFAEAAARRRLSPARLGQRLRGDLDQIVARALRDEPEHRWSSVAQLAADLRRHLAGQPIEARRGGVVYRAGKFVRRHRVAVAVAASLVVLVLGFAGLALWQADQRAAERDLARREKIKAETVSAAMVDLFRLLDPKGGREYAEAGKEILDAGSRRIEDDFADQPEIQATLRATLGSIYQRLGFYPEAEAQLERALAQHRRLFGSDHHEVADVLGSFGILYKNQGRLDEAASALREALAMRRRLDPDDPDIAANLSTLAAVEAGRGDAAASTKLLGDAIALLRRLGRHESPGMARSLNDLGTVLSTTGRLAEAEAAYRQALDIGRAIGRHDGLDAANTNANLAGLAFRRGDFQAAIEGYRVALEISRRLHGDDHPEVQVLVTNLAVALHVSGQLAAAEPLYRESLAHLRQRLGDAHPDIALNLNNFGALLRDLERYDEAEAMLGEALAMRRDLLGPDHPENTACLHLLGQIALATDRPELAREHFREAVAINRARRGDDHEQTGVGLGNLAKWALATDRPEEALRLVAEASAIFEAALPADHWRHAEMDTLEGDARARLGHLEVGRELLESGVAVLEAERGADSLVTREAMRRLARLDSLR